MKHGWEKSENHAGKAKMKHLYTFMYSNKDLSVFYLCFIRG